MCDYSSQAAIRKEALAEMIRMAEEAGLYEDEPTLDEAVEAVKRVRELVDRLENKEAFHQLTAYACAEEILKALDGEIGSVEPVKLEALDGEQE